MFGGENLTYPCVDYKGLRYFQKKLYTQTQKELSLKADESRVENLYNTLSDAIETLDEETMKTGLMISSIDELIELTVVTDKPYFITMTAELTSLLLDNDTNTDISQGFVVRYDEEEDGQRFDGFIILGAGSGTGDWSNKGTIFGFRYYVDGSESNKVERFINETEFDKMSDTVNQLDNSSEQINESLAYISELIMANNAATHNSIYRGKYLGTTVTDEQWAAIKAGTFDDLYIGDYWTINGVNWRIAAFDYYLNTGSTVCTDHHVVIIPDTVLYNAQMNTSNTTSGGYVGSAMYTSNLAQAKTDINNAFGSSHILSHEMHFTSDVTNGYPSAGSNYTSTVDLMSEPSVYGSMIFTPTSTGTTTPHNYINDNSQYPLFAYRHDLIGIQESWWFRDVANATAFCNVATNGLSNTSPATSSHGVRPAFLIY